MHHSLTELADLQVQVFLLLQDLLPPVHGSFKLVDDGVEGGVSPRGPLESLADAELLTADLIQYGGER